MIKVDFAGNTLSWRIVPEESESVMATSGRQKAEQSCLPPLTESELEVGLDYELSKSSSSDILPPERPHLLPKQCHIWGTNCT